LTVLKFNPRFESLILKSKIMEKKKLTGGAAVALFWASVVVIMILLKLFVLK